MFILIGQESHTLPYAIGLDGTRLTEAVTAAQAIFEESQAGASTQDIDPTEEPQTLPSMRLADFQASFMVDTQTAQVYRVFHDGEHLVLTDAQSAFEKLGVLTTPEYLNTRKEASAC